MNNIYLDFEKVKATYNSCKSLNHYRVTYRMYQNWKRKWEQKYNDSIYWILDRELSNIDYKILDLYVSNR